MPLIEFQTRDQLDQPTLFRGSGIMKKEGGRTSCELFKQEESLKMCSTIQSEMHHSQQLLQDLFSSWSQGDFSWRQNSLITTDMCVTDKTRIFYSFSSTVLFPLLFPPAPNPSSLERCQNFLYIWKEMAEANNMEIGHLLLAVQITFSLKLLILNESNQDNWLWFSFTSVFRQEIKYSSTLGFSVNFVYINLYI